MNQITPENQILKEIPISSVMEYLRANDWKLVPHPNQWIFLFEGPLDDYGKPIKLVLPKHMDFEDAWLRLSEAINLLSAIQEVAPEKLIDEILIKYHWRHRYEKSSEAKDIVTTSLAWGFKFVLAFIVIIVMVGGGFDAIRNILSRGRSDNISFIKIVAAQESMPLPNWKTTIVKTVDDRGKEIELVMGVLWDPYRWALGSTKQVSINEKGNDKDDKYDVESLIKALDANEARTIIAVGVASHENVKENLDKEEARAKARMDVLVDACQRHFTGKMPHIYSTNLGAFSPDKNPSQYSASERRVILLVVIRGEGSADLTSGIRNALAKAGQDQTFVFDARDYSIFNTDRFQVSRRR